MEFKEYLQIIKKYQTIFWFSWLTVIFLGLFTVAVQRNVYRGEMTLLVGRSAIGNSEQNNKPENGRHSKNILQNKNNYDYYYQLEANKSIANILVQSLKDRKLMKDILSATTGNKQLSPEDYWVLSKIKGEVLGSGYVKVVIKSHQKEKIRMISNELGKKLNGQIQQIVNEDAQKIKIIFEPAEIELQKKPYLVTALAVVFGGLLLAIFIVLGKYYWDDEK